MRDELVEKVIETLNTVRSGRLVWLTIAELNRTDIKENGVRLSFMFV